MLQVCTHLKRDEVKGEYRRLHNEELYDLHSPPNVIWVVKSRRMKWARYWREVFCWGDLK
jgi:hypothetical protein